MKRTILTYVQALILVALSCSMTLAAAEEFYPNVPVEFGKLSCNFDFPDRSSVAQFSAILEGEKTVGSIQISTPKCLELMKTIMNSCVLSFTANFDIKVTKGSDLPGALPAFLSPTTYHLEDFRDVKARGKTCD